MFCLHSIPTSSLMPPYWLLPRIGLKEIQPDWYIGLFICRCQIIRSVTVKRMWEADVRNRCQKQMTEADVKVHIVLSCNDIYIYIDIVLFAFHSDFFFDATILVAPKDRPERNTTWLIYSCFYFQMREADVRRRCQKQMSEADVRNRSQKQMTETDNRSRCEKQMSEAYVRSICQKQMTEASCVDKVINYSVILYIIFV